MSSRLPDRLAPTRTGIGLAAHGLSGLSAGTELQGPGLSWIEALSSALRAEVAGGRATLADARDEQDVGASLNGDGAAFERLVRRHQDALARHLHRFTRDRGELEALVQESFVEAWRGLRGWRAEAPFAHWLKRIATRVGYRYWKARRRLENQREPADDGLLRADDDVPAQVGVREAAEHVHALLARLAPRDRLGLTLIYLDGCDVARAAELTGWSRTMVKVQAHRARKRLAKLLEGRA